VGKCRGKSLQAVVFKLALGAIYDIWHQRNAIIHGKGFGTEEIILKYEGSLSNRVIAILGVSA